jgi:hypothetical protein
MKIVNSTVTVLRYDTNYKTADGQNGSDEGQIEPGKEVELDYANFRDVDVYVSTVDAIRYRQVLNHAVITVTSKREE